MTIDSETGTRHTMYVDESGHAGINYLDARQPFHVAAGVFVSDIARDEIRDLVRSHAAPRAELKGSKLLQSAPGRQAAVALLRAVYAAGATPFFVVMDRRFSIAGKIVDVFLDPFHQDAVAWLPTAALKERRRITEMLSELLDAAAIEAFATAYRAPTVDAFSRVLGLIVPQVRRTGHFRLAGAFEGAAKSVATIVESESYGSEHGEWAALNIPALCHLLRLVDRFADDKGTFSVVHDENDQFRRLFPRVVASLTSGDSEHPDVRFPDGTIARMTLRNCGEFRMENSADELMLQAADLIAGVVSRVARQAMSSVEKPKRDIRELAALTMPALRYEDDDPAPHFGAAYANERTIHALISLAMRSEDDLAGHKIPRPPRSASR
jgi:hypothetical protein